MKKILFILSVILSSNAIAATGTGHAQTELTNPLTVTNWINVNLGTIAIDPAAGVQAVSINATSDSTVTCPGTYVCSGSATRGLVTLQGAQDEAVNVSVLGSTATLNDGSGNTLIFDPVLESGETLSGSLSGPSGSTNIGVGGSIDFTGSEVSGTYSSLNAGGSGYTMTVNY